MRLLPVLALRITLAHWLLVFGAGGLSAVSGNALAHAVVTASSLQKTAVKPDSATAVVLYFNSNVELRLSRVYLVRKGDVKESVPIVAGKKPGEVIVQLPALPIGEYALSYKIFAADSHITEDVIRFHVE